MRCSQIKPLGTVDLRKILHPAGTGRPFYAERIANECLGIPIIFDRPYMNAFPTRLPNGPERHSRTLRMKSYLFDKLTQRSFI